MVDVSLFSSLLKALKPETKLVLVGDKNQLPSVGAGNVLSDLLKSNVLASHNLTQIFRQDENSKIIENAELINQSIVPDLKQKSDDFFYIERNEAIDIANETVGLASSRLPQFIKSIKGKTQPEIQVLAPMRNGEAGVNALNLKLQQALNPQESFKKQIMLDKQTFREGDKVMQTINNYDLEWKKQDKYGETYGAGVFNGDIGKILKIIESGEVMVKFDDDRICYYPRESLSELTHAYAITIHKSQGSEFDYVIIPIVGGPPTILTKNLLYTAVTRAKKMVVLVGSKKIVSYVVGNNFQQQRHTGLLQFLLDGFVEIKRLYE
jgi:exodeoxyribonuclease V alpha subunit